MMRTGMGSMVFFGFKKWLAPPDFLGDEEKTILAFTIHKVQTYFLYGLVLAALFLIPFLAQRKAESYALLLTILIFMIISRIFLFRGQLEFASIFLISVVWTLFAGMTVISGGIGSPTLFMMMATAIASGLLLKPRIGFMFVILTILSSGGLAVLEQYRFGQVRFFNMNPIAAWFVFALALLFMHGLMSLVVSNHKNALARERQQNLARQQAEQALLQSEERFQMFMRYFPGLAYMKESSGRILFVNQGFRTYLGLNPEEMVGRTSVEFFGPEFGEQISRYDQLVLETGISQDIDEEFAGRTWISHKFVIEQPGGSPLLGGITVDTSERRQAKEALQVSESRFRALIEQAPVAISLSRDGRGLYANPKLLQMFGLSSVEESVGRIIADYFAPSFREQSKERTRLRSLGLAVPSEFESVGLRAGGTEFPVLVAVTSVQLADGSASLAFVTDITERKQAVSALRESEKRYRGLFENASLGIFKTAPDGSIIDVNPEFARIFGYPSPDVMKSVVKNAVELYADPQTRAEIVRLQVESPGMNQFEVAFRRENGCIFIAQLTVRSALNSDGNVQFLEGFVEDISLRKQAEDALRESQSTLNAIIDSTSDMIWSVDPESFGLMTFNRGLSSYFLSQRNMRISAGMRPEDLFTSQEFVGRWREFYQRALKEGPYTTEYLTSAGTTTLMLSFNILQKEGKVFGISVFGKDITERNRAQEQLQILKYSIDTAPDSAYWMDMQGRFIYVNDTACKALGFTREELLQMAIQDINPHAAPLRWAQVIRDLQERKNLTLESVHRRKDGSEFPVELNSAYIRFGDQEYVNGFAKDITERKLADEKIAQSEKKYREVFEVNKDGIAIFIMSPDGIPQPFVELNPAAYHMLGYTKEEMLCFTPMMLEPEVTPNQAGFRQTQLETKGIVNFETVLAHKDGHRVYTEFTAQMIQYEGRPAIMNIIRDITERKRAEETLRESEEKYRALVENSLQGVILFQGSQAAYVNSRLCEITGYSVEELLPASPFKSPELIHPDDRARVAERSQRFNRGEVGYDKDAYRLLRKDGEIRHVEVSAKALTLEGKSAGILTMVDVTERYQREHELQAIATLSAVLRTAPTRAEMLPVIVEQLINLLKIDSATIEIIEPQSGEAVVEVGQGIWKSLIGTRQQPGTGINAIISETRRPYYSPDLEKDSSPFFNEWARKGIRGCAGVPLIAQEKLIGFIWIGRKTDIAGPELRLLSAIADITANAIQRATSHEQALQAASDLALAYDTTLESWARALEMRDQETEGHTRRVVGMTLLLAQAMGIHGVELENTRRGALLHDIGKMGIPDSVLLKPGTLDEREWEIMRRHTDYARDLIIPIDYLRNTIDIPINHHEKWDGTGYPRGLKGEEIPLAARLFAIADVWDALTSDRRYRKAWPRERALKFIQEQNGRHFDPRVVELFLDVIKADLQ